MKHKHWLTVVFGFDPKTMTVKKEILGGLTTFLMMAYILAVNPEVLGGTGMDSQAVFTTTALASLIATLVDEQGNMTRLKQAFIADSIGTTVGALLGTSTISTYVESASGVNAGGRSGLTAFTTALCFALSLFLSPLFLSIPSQATAAALVLVGVMMMADIRRIDFQDYLSAIPCFVCIIFMPLAYSISDGILLGMITWVLIHLLSGHYRSLNVGIVILSILFILKYAFL